MKKNFKFYVIAWAALLVLFNVIAFISVGWEGQEKYTPSFWIGYSFITVSFIGQFIFAYIAFKADTAKKVFYNISVFQTSYTGLIVSFAVGGLCMLISPLPYWIGAIVCMCVLALNIFAAVKPVAAVAEIERIDEKIKTQTFFIRSLTVDAETLMEQANSPAVRAECNKVYEAIRYSDPMSHDALASVETQITLKFEEFSGIVQTGDIENVVTAAKELVVLVENRNKKCKLLK